ncbi:MAG: recombinase family protein [Lachnospiraceae bacterium]|nr:recombinase family protein [Lachnospiraceae bacterium]
MKSAVAYMRMSTDRQEHSIESQERLINEYAKQNNYLIQHLYIDEGISGRNAEKRPQFLQMIDDSSKKYFEYVLIYDSSRFARNLEQSLVYKSILKKNGVSIVSITEPTLDEDTSLITDALFGAMNEMYSRKLSKNVKRGLEQKALRGEFCAHAPFGYNYDKNLKMLVLNQQEAPVAKYIFSEILKGRTPYSISTEMREKNIRTKNGITLERRRIEYMIKNPVYKGYLRWTSSNGIIVQKSNHEPLISETEFEEIQRIAAQRALRLRRNAKPPEFCNHWLSGIIYCSECNCVYTYVKPREHEGKKARFRCSGQSRGQCSSGISFKVDVLEKQIYAILEEILENDNTHFCLEIPEKSSLKTDYSNDIKKLKQALNRAKEAFLAGLDSITEYGENKKTLLSEIEKLECMQNKNNHNKIDTHCFNAEISDLLALLKSNENPISKREAFRTLVEKVLIEKNTKNITLYFFA